jgi:hypothetical protein
MLLNLVTVLATAVLLKTMLTSSMPAWPVPSTTRPNVALVSDGRVANKDLARRDGRTENSEPGTVIVV